jgi:hypothetical protein
MICIGRHDYVSQIRSEHGVDALLQMLFRHMDSGKTFENITPSEHVCLYQFSDTGENPTSLRHLGELLSKGVPQHKGVVFELNTLNTIAYELMNHHMRHEQNGS